MQPRDYQQNAINSIYEYFTANNGNPIVVAPTGAGKSVIIALFAKGVVTQWHDQRILILTHVKELVEQNYLKLKAAWPGGNIGVNAASLRRRDTSNAVIFASVQTVYKKAFQLGRFDLVMIDECHLLNPSGEGMYNELLRELRRINPLLKVIGFSATPYRMKDGHLIGDENSIFTDIAFEIKIRDLIENGYLCPVVPQTMATKFDTSNVKVRGNEYVRAELEAVFDDDYLTTQACAEILAYGEARRAGLVFCSGVKHAFHVRDQLRAMGATAETVTGSTPQGEREQIIHAYKTGRIKYLTNCDVLTTGFDAPETDLLAVLRKTKSPGLWVQMVGRGMRIAPGKADCVVLDFAGNTDEHGPIDQIRPPRRPSKSGEFEAPQKTCPICNTLSLAFARACPCGFEFPIGEGSGTPTHMAVASTAPLLSFVVPVEESNVTRITLRRWVKPGKPDSLLAVYYAGLREVAREWVCLEHNGNARLDALKWWAFFVGGNVPRTVTEALGITGDTIRLENPLVMRTKKNGKYNEIIDYRVAA